MATRTVANPLTPEQVSPGLKAALEHAAAVERVKAWECGGVCSTLLWPDGAFVCSAYNPAIDGLCTRHWGHDGDHVECCSADGQEFHAIRTWPGRKAA